MKKAFLLPAFLLLTLSACNQGGGFEEVEVDDSGPSKYDIAIDELKQRNADILEALQELELTIPERIEVINPCGDSPVIKHEEVLLKLAPELIISYFRSIDGEREFLSALEPGDYVTTDSQECYFTITEDFEITD